jgi:hypothetical protein
MANRPFVEGLQKLIAGDISLDSGNWKAVLIDAADVTINTAAGGHDNLDDISAGVVGSASSAFTSLSVADGVWDFDDPTMTGTGGDVAEQVVIYLDTGNAATSALFLLFDTGTGLPFTPPAGAWSFVYQVDSGANKCCKFG